MKKYDNIYINVVLNRWNEIIYNDINNRIENIIVKPMHIKKISTLQELQNEILVNREKELNKVFGSSVSIIVGFLPKWKLVMKKGKLRKEYETDEEKKEKVKRKYKQGTGVPGVVISILLLINQFQYQCGNIYLN